MSTTKNPLSAAVVVDATLVWKLIGTGYTEADYISLSRMHQFRPPNRSEPTQAQPGSSEKVRVMTERYRTGQPLHHSSDATCVLCRHRESLLQGL